MAWLSYPVLAERSQTPWSGPPNEPECVVSSEWKRKYRGSNCCHAGSTALSGRLQMRLASHQLTALASKFSDMLLALLLKADEAVLGILKSANDCVTRRP